MTKRLKNNVVLYNAPNIIKKIKDFHLVLNPEAPNLMVVDEVGRKILKLSNGNHTRKQIVELISGEFNCDRQNVRDFIDSLLLAKFVGEQSAPTFNREEKNLVGLETLQLYLTQACNLRCKHCYFSSGEPYQDELSNEEFLHLIKEAKKMGIKSFTITGGEPFLRRKLLFEILREATDQGFSNISMSTNGTLLTKKDAFLLKKYKVRVGVSLDGAAETHDYIRGKGVFDKAIRAIKLLRDAKVHTTIGMTLMKANIKEIEKMLYLAKELGVSGVFLNTVRVKGRAETYRDDTEIPAEDVISGLRQSWSISRKIGVKTTVESMWSSVKQLRPRNLCGAGRKVLSIAANGDVYPCGAFHGEEAFRAGNIRKKPIDQIWRDSPLIKAFTSLTLNDIEGCRNCELRLICGGGCLQDNYEAHGVLNKCNRAECSVLKETYWYIISEFAKDMWREMQ